MLMRSVGLVEVNLRQVAMNIYYANFPRLTTVYKILGAFKKHPMVPTRPRPAGIAFYFFLIPLLTGCKQHSSGEEVNGLSGLVYNYSDESIATVWVAGQGVGGPTEAVKPGDVTGGGQTCCFSMDPNRLKVPVRVQLGIDKEYIVQAKVEQPWPKDANTVIVHILPKRKIILEATLGVGTAPRSDLLNARLSELGIEKKVNSDQYMLSGRSDYK